MTVGELKTLLATYPDGMKVVVDCYERNSGGYDDPKPEGVLLKEWPANHEPSWWLGKYRPVRPSDPRDDDATPALCIGR